MIKLVYELNETTKLGFLKANYNFENFEQFKTNSLVEINSLLHVQCKCDLKMTATP